MSTIVVNPKDKNEFLFVTQLLEKLGIDVKILSDEDKEDIALSLMMAEVDQEDRVSEEEVLKKLKIDEN
jgi:NADPH:quinone reductase-like Zn-dependent oxidoreductase